MDLYKTDKMEMVNEGVLDKTYLALSRDPTIPKVSARESYVGTGEKIKTISKRNFRCCATATAVRLTQYNGLDVVKQ